MAREKGISSSKPVKTSDTKPEDKSTTDGTYNREAYFAALNKIIRRDMNNTSHRYWDDDGMYYFPYKRKDVMKYMRDPAHHEKQLRRAMNAVYTSSTHFRRLIQYFVGLTDWSYIVQPYRIDPTKANVRTTNLNYRRVLNTLSSMDIKTQFPRILTVCLREDVFYGTMWVKNDDITIQQLPSDYCTITTVQGGVPNVTFNFRYFDTRKDLLDYYPQEFKLKYDIYQKDKRHKKWQELDSPTSFAVKCNSDILDYAVPPFVGLLRDLYDIEDFKDMSLTRAQLENYAMVVMTLPLTENGDWGIDLNKAEEFWRNLDDVLPQEIGSILTPMPVDKIDFERNNTADNDNVAEAEKNLMTDAGVSSLLFNNDKASANALLLSIKADQAITYGIVKNIGAVINRYLHEQNFGKNFIVNFLDVSPFNRKEVGDSYLKSAAYGLPTISAYAASQGIGQAELDSMNFLEEQVMKIPEKFKPIVSSSQLSSEDIKANSSGESPTDGQAGAPKKDIGEVSDSREANSENE